MFLDFFCMQIFCKELQKIAKSDHTDQDRSLNAATRCTLSRLPYKASFATSI